MARILVPTRNRPAALDNLLGYLHQFYPGTGVIIADGSADQFKAETGRAAARSRKLDVDYRPYPYYYPFFDRILDVLGAINDPFVVMGADDDYPMMELFEQEEHFLAGNPDYVSAMGPTVNLMYDGSAELKVRLNTVRPITADDPRKRAMQYAAWPFSTTYAITRRAALINRYRRSREVFLTGFYDYGAGVQDCFQGKIKALPDLGYFGTRNSNHSYLRPESKLVFARKAQLLLAYAENIKSDFVTFGGATEDEATEKSETITRWFVAEYCGRRAFTQSGFENSTMANELVVRQQSQLFHGLFTRGTAARKTYGERLEYVAAALRANNASSDNGGEKAFYESLEEQAGTEVRDAAI